MFPPDLPPNMRPPTAPRRKADASLLPQQWREMKSRQSAPRREGLQHLFKAVDSAMETHRSVLGEKPRDPDLRIYENLSQKDLQDMTNQYGVEEVGRYVMTMENRRLGGR